MGIKFREVHIYSVRRCFNSERRWCYSDRYS